MLTISFEGIFLMQNYYLHSASVFKKIVTCFIYIYNNFKCGNGEPESLNRIDSSMGRGGG